MDTQIADRIERAIGEGPEPRPSLDELLADGRRAVRRRQLALGGASAMAVAAIAFAASTLVGSTSDHAGDRVAEQPTATAGPTTEPSRATDPTPTTAASPPPPTEAEIRGVLHRLTVSRGDDGVVRPSEGKVLRVVENPFGVAAPASSYGVELQVGGGVYWYVDYTAADQSGGAAARYAGDAKRSFEGWLRSMSGIADGSTTTVGPDVWPGIADLDLVAFVGDTEELAPSDGVTILEQRAHISVGDSFAGPGDQTAAAEVRTADGERYYVLARRFDGKQPQYIAVPAEDGGADLDAFLDLARDRYAEGGGGLL